MHNALPKEASLTASVYINILFTDLHLFGMFCFVLVPVKRVDTTYHILFSDTTESHLSTLACSRHSNHSTHSTSSSFFLQASRDNGTKENR